MKKRTSTPPSLSPAPSRKNLHSLSASPREIPCSAFTGISCASINPVRSISPASSLSPQLSPFHARALLSPRQRTRAQHPHPGRQHPRRLRCLLCVLRAGDSRRGRHRPPASRHWPQRTHRLQRTYLQPGLAHAPQSLEPRDARRQLQVFRSRRRRPALRHHHGHRHDPRSAQNPFAGHRRVQGRRHRQIHRRPHHLRRLRVGPAALS